MQSDIFRSSRDPKGSDIHWADKTTSFVDTRPQIIVIDQRPLSRYCLSRAMQMTLEDSAVIVFATVQEYLAQKDNLTRGSTILLCAPGGRTVDEKLAEDISLLTRTNGTLPIILVADHENPKYILEAFEHGVRGYLPTTCTFEVAVEAIRLVRAGGAYVPATSIMSFYYDCGTSGSATLNDKADGFTARQTAVLKALREGKANKIIAYELNMRESTVKVHVRNIMRKLNARNRTEVTFKTMELFSSSRK